MENSKFTRNPAWVYKSEPSSHFVTDIYLPSVRLQQSNSREEELEQIKITFQHYLLPSHMRSQTFNGYFKLQHFLSIQWPESSFFFFFFHINRYLEEPEKYNKLNVFSTSKLVFICSLNLLHFSLLISAALGIINCCEQSRAQDKSSFFSNDVISLLHMEGQTLFYIKEYKIRQNYRTRVR